MSVDAATLGQGSGTSGADATPKRPVQRFSERASAPPVSEPILSTEATGPDGAACWKTIGIWSPGGPSCPRLATLIHCHHCPVFADAARRLFDRPVPPSLLAERTAELAEQDAPANEQRQSLTVFRLANEWLALPTRSIAEVTNPSPIHHLPHRSADILLGLTAVRGELHPALSLSALLALPGKDGPAANPHAIARMLLMRHDEGQFAFQVDEVHGVVRRVAGSGPTLPSTLSGVDRRFIAAATRANGQLVGILDPELVIYGFAKALQ